MPTGPNTILVSTTAELNEAYDVVSQLENGGTILLDGDGGPYNITLRAEPGPQNHVTFKSANPENPAQLTQIYLRDVDNIRIEGVKVDSTAVEGRADYRDDLFVQGGDNIEIVDTHFFHDGAEFLTSSADKAETVGIVRNSSDFTFSGNTVEGYYHGLSILETDGIEILDNEVFHMQGDGMRFGGVQDVMISGNHFHDFYGSTQNVTHSDMIQFWGSNADTLTRDVTITNNSFISGDGKASQTIFIRNEQYGDEGEVGERFQNITITENVIYNGHQHGIQVADSEGIVVANNTLLWNPDAVMVQGNGAVSSKPPTIVIRSSLDADVYENIASGIYDLYPPSGSGGSNFHDNQWLSYSNPQSDHYVSNHFVNALEGGSVDYRDLRLRPDSEWNDQHVGATLSQSVSETEDGVEATLTVEVDSADFYDLSFDASLTLDESGYADDDEYDFIWVFEDDTVVEGLTADRSYEEAGEHEVTLQVLLDGVVVDQITRSFSVSTKDIFELDFENGITDISDAFPKIVVTGDDNDDESMAEHGFRIGDGNKLELTRDTHGIHNLETFGLSFDMELTGDKQVGTFLDLYKVMTGTVLDTGQVSFKLTTDEGVFTVTSDDAIYDDGEEHRIGLAYDGSTGQLELFADGERVGTTDAEGMTAPRTYYGLIFGNTFYSSLDAYVDHIEMSSDPVVAGELSPVEDEPPVEEEPIEDLPIEEEPVEEEPPVEEEEPPVEEEPVEEEDPAPEAAKPLKAFFEKFSKILGSKLGALKANSRSVENDDSEEDSSIFETLWADLWLDPVSEEDDAKAEKDDDDDESAFESIWAAFG